MNPALPSSPAVRSPGVVTLGETDRGVNTTPGVSWGAIIAGATGAAALSLILLILGTGLGLSSVSPWTGQGVSATTFGVSTILWLAFTQIAAAGMGGYLAGRLRTRWLAIHTDEVYFRDTAHGFLAWAVATLLTASLLTSAIGAIVGAGASVAGGAASTAATGAVAAGSAAARSDGSPSGEDGMGYFIDSLFRSTMSAPAEPTVAAATDASTTSTPSIASMAPTAAPVLPDSPAVASAEVARIFVNDLRVGSLSQEDKQYVGQVVAQRTGLSQAEAEKRVSDTFAKVQTKAKEAETAARDAADKARKASAGAALWLFVSLLAGAFVASLAATYGGRRRDL